MKTFNNKECIDNIKKIRNMVRAFIILDKCGEKFGYIFCRFDNKGFCHTSFISNIIFRSCYKNIDNIASYSNSNCGDIIEKIDKTVIEILNNDETKYKLLSCGFNYNIDFFNNWEKFFSENGYKVLCVL